MRVILSLILVAWTTAAAAQKAHRHHHAHEHGRGTLEIAIDGRSVEMRLEAPGMDIVGFERQPKSATDETKVAEAVARLEKAQALFTLPAAAQCALTSAKAALGSDTPASGSDGKEDHTEFTATYAFTCANTAALTSIEFPYFKIYKDAERLTVSVVSGSGQSQATVTRGKPKLALKP